jgi:hypothetical protein
MTRRARSAQRGVDEHGASRLSDNASVRATSVSTQCGEAREEGYVHRPLTLLKRVTASLVRA